MTELNLTNGNVDVKVRYTDFSFSVEFKNGSRKLYHEATIEEFDYNTNDFNGCLIDIINDLEEDGFEITSCKKINVA